MSDQSKNQNQTAKPATPAPAKIEAEKELTPEQKAKLEERKKNRTEAKNRIKAFLKDNATTLGGLVKDIELFIGTGTGAVRANVVRSVNSDLRSAFLEKKSLSEMDIFKLFKIGRPEMVTKIRILVLCPNPADRVWVKFDETKEVYNVIGTGANPPQGWCGYVPSTKTL